MRALRLGPCIATGWFLAAMVCITWRASGNEAGAGAPHADSARLPNFVGELIVISHETVNVEESLATTECPGLFFRKPDGLRRVQWDLSSLFCDEFKRDDVGIFRASSKICVELSSYCINTKRPQFQRRSADVFYDDNGAIICISRYPRKCHSGLLFELEADPGEYGGFHCDNEAHLRESSISTSPTGSRGRGGDEELRSHDLRLIAVNSSLYSRNNQKADGNRKKWPRRTNCPCRHLSR